MMHVRLRDEDDSQEQATGRCEQGIRDQERYEDFVQHRHNPQILWRPARDERLKESTGTSNERRQRQGPRGVPTKIQEMKISKDCDRHKSSTKPSGSLTTTNRRTNETRTAKQNARKRSTCADLWPWAAMIALL